MVSASAVRGSDGVTHIGLTNVNPNAPVTIKLSIQGLSGSGVTGRVLTAAAIDAHNSFDAPDTVKPAPFSDASISGSTLTMTLPAKSVVMLDVK